MGDPRIKHLRGEALKSQGGKCHYCKCPITLETATADHKWPRARDGWTTQENIAAACADCNFAKGTLSEGQFFRLIDARHPIGASTEILTIWAARRIWRKTNRVCARIRRLSAVSSISIGTDAA